VTLAWSRWVSDIFSLKERQLRHSQRRRTSWAFDCVPKQLLEVGFWPRKKIYLRLVRIPSFQHPNITGADLPTQHQAARSAALAVMRLHQNSIHHKEQCVVCGDTRRWWADRQYGDHQHSSKRTCKIGEQLASMMWSRITKGVSGEGLTRSFLAPGVVKTGF